MGVGRAVLVGVLVLVLDVGVLVGGVGVAVDGAVVVLVLVDVRLVVAVLFSFHGHVIPEYHRPNINPKAPRAGISTVRKTGIDHRPGQDQE